MLINCLAHSSYLHLGELPQMCLYQESYSRFTSAKLNLVLFGDTQLVLHSLSSEDLEPVQKQCLEANEEVGKQRLSI